MKLNKDEIAEKVNSLNLEEGTYIVFGSGPMALHDLRLVSDIDMMATKEVSMRLEAEGWKRLQKNENDAPLVFEDFEIHENWNFSHFSPSLEELLERSEVYKGVRFASLEDVLKWKSGGGRKKDAKDVALIKNYLNGN